MPEEPDVPEVVTEVDGKITSTSPLPLLLMIAPPLNVIRLTSSIAAAPTGITESPRGEE